MELGTLLLSATLLPYLPQTTTPSRPHVYAVAMIAGSYHPSNEFHYRDVIKSVGGGSFDVGGGAGVRVSRSLAVEGELLYGGTVSTPQATFYTEQARDILLNALVRYRAAAIPGISFVGGGGHAWTRTSEDPAQLNRPAMSWNGATVTGGFDIAAVNAAYAVLGPSFRVRWVKRASVDDGWNGLGGVSIQIGATVLLR
jgi:hypothetical protein